MWWYNILLPAYYLIIGIISAFNSKAKLFISGRKNLLSRIEADLSNESSQKVWFHCASLGEFEQARPVIERFRLENQGLKIVLTFYSPSGYELRKNYSGADYIYYLPFDYPSKVRRFVKAVNPTLALFVKYEFWPNYLKELHKQNIPTLCFSAIFRKDQVFFQWYGKSYRNLLSCFKQIFVQNKESERLLNSINISQHQLAGDTRFDRVNEIAQNPKSLPDIASFVNGRPCMVIGSSWQEDMDIINPLIRNNEKGIRFIIAPHEIEENKIKKLVQSLGEHCIRYSHPGDNIQNAEVLIIDSIGLLSSIYQFANIAYVGGAFGKGLHNILEAIIYRVPVFFGNKNYHKFQEALDLIERNIAFPVGTTGQLTEGINSYLENPEKQAETVSTIDKYISENLGVTDKIWSYSKDLLK